MDQQHTASSDPSPATPSFVHRWQTGPSPRVLTPIGHQWTAGEGEGERGVRAPGTCVVTTVSPDGDPGQDAPRTSHHCTPWSLARLARDLYGSVAPITLVGVRVATTEAGDALTPGITAALPAITERVRGLLAAVGGPGHT